MTADGVTLKRRGGRWVKHTVSESSPALNLPPLAVHLRGARRLGGRWVPRGSGTDDRPSVWRHLGHRLWLLVMPLVGIMAAHSYHVRPAIADIEAARVSGRTQLLDRKDDLRLRIDGWHNEIQALTAEVDTLHAPRLAFHQAVHDSLLRLREGQALPLTADQLDSLRALRDQLRVEMLAARAAYWSRASVLGNLAAMQVALQDSIDTIRRLALVMESPSPAPPKRGLTLRSVATYVGYAVAPVLGFMWAHSSS